MATRKRRIPPLNRGDSFTRSAGEAVAAKGVDEVSVVVNSPRSSVSWLYLTVCGAVLLAVFAWAYWPTLVSLVKAWDQEPDYSHGYLVVPLGVWFLWVRRDRFPGIDHTHAWFGLVLVLLSVVARGFSSAIAFSFDGWSILVWVLGSVWLLFGYRVAFWSLPSITFLSFMVPVPFFAERTLSLPLQKVATKLSVVALQFLGQPAIAEGNVILLGEHRMEVAQACSGLRIFVGIIALAFAYLVVVRRVWWQRALILLAIAPIALVANAARIVLTGLLYQYVSSDAARGFSHDFAGWVMIPFAAVLFGLILWYLDRVVRVEVISDGRSILVGERSTAAVPPE